MPEGPTLHKLARDHTALFAGQTLSITSPQGRFAEAAATLDGRKFVKAEAWGKHLFYDFAGGPRTPTVLHVHLGLYGKFRVAAFTKSDGPPEPRGAVRVRMTGTTHTLDLNGPNQCEVIAAAARDDILARLGPDPLRPDADPDKAWHRIAASRQSIGQLLMDQNVIAGVGNIYRAELLWLIKLHPRTPGKAVTKKQFDTLWRDTARLMHFAVDFGMIVTTKLAEKKNPPKKPSAEQRFNIYKQPKCPRCGGKIETYALAGRKVYACGGCQVVQGDE